MEHWVETVTGGLVDPAPILEGELGCNYVVGLPPIEGTIEQATFEDHSCRHDRALPGFWATAFDEYEPGCGGSYAAIRLHASKAAAVSYLINLPAESIEDDHYRWRNDGFLTYLPIGHEAKHIHCQCYESCKPRESIQ